MLKSDRRTEVGGRRFPLSASGFCDQKAGRVFDHAAEHAADRNDFEPLDKPQVLWRFE
jgi:hypothetical protein